MRLFAIGVILISMWSCHSSGLVRSEQDDCEGIDCHLTPTLPGNQSVSVPYPLERHKKVVNLKPDEIDRWRRIALEAAMSDTAWSRFGGERLIERPYKVDTAQIGLHGIDKSCEFVGNELHIYGDAMCDQIRVILPTDQHTACAILIIEVIIARDSGQVVNMRDSFWTISPMRKPKTKETCHTRPIDKPAHGIPRPIN